MKTKLIFIIGALALSSCGLQNDPSWTLQNPLDTYEVNWHSPSWGVWGPGGFGPPYRPELNLIDP